MTSNRSAEEPYILIRGVVQVEKPYFTLVQNIGTQGMHARVILLWISKMTLLDCRVLDFQAWKKRKEHLPHTSGRDIFEE